MKFFYTVLLGLLLFQPVYAESEAVNPDKDRVSIGYIPSRGAVFKGEPYRVLEAKSLPHHKNKDIEEFHRAVKHLESQGITDNSTHFHQAMIYIETVYQGERIRLFYNDDTDLKKFDQYEKDWKILHNKIYKYLTKDLLPGNKVDNNP